MSKDYVSREDVTESVYQALCEPSDSDAWRRIGRAIRELPAADVVEVVRCGQCKFFQSSGCFIGIQGARISSDNYCAWGQRKDG